MLCASIPESGTGFDLADRFGVRFLPERTMTNKTLVLGLLLACLANLICLAGYW
jgi:hypothetical protein